MLWCGVCFHAHYSDFWEVKGTKHGVCPKCGVSSYRNAFSWEKMADAHGWLLPINGKKYEPVALF